MCSIWMSNEICYEYSDADITIVMAQSRAEDVFRFIVNTRRRLPPRLVHDWVTRVK